MSFNSKAFLADRERLLEPDSKLRTGNAKRYKPTFSQVSEMLDGMTPEQRAAMAAEPISEAEKDRWNEENEKRLGL